MKYIVEKDFNFLGLRCVVIFQRGGYRCGYVGVPKSHRFYGKDYCDVEEILGFDVFSDNGMVCHGGLTYSSAVANSTYPIKSDLWWFGFDCAHAGDGIDVELARKLFPDEREFIEVWSRHTILLGFEPKSVEFVVAECKKLAKLLGGISNGKDNEDCN